MPPPVILTTGANQGLGFAIIQLIAQRLPSALHLLACRDLASGQKALENLRLQGIESEIEVVQLDVTNDNQIEQAVDHVKSKYHRLDGELPPPSSLLPSSSSRYIPDSLTFKVLINNAGILRPPANESLPALRAAYDEMCSTNLTSVAVVTTAFLPLLHGSPDPKVINITSGLGSIQNTMTKKMGRFPPYGASKIGMNGATVHMQTAENDRVEAEGGKGVPRVRYFVVAPGVLKTAFTNFYARGKDPLQGAEAVVRLALHEKGEFEGGTHWEFEEGEMRVVPW